MVLENNNLNQFADLIAKCIDKLDIEEMPQVYPMEKFGKRKDADIFSSCKTKQEDNPEK